MSSLGHPGPMLAQLEPIQLGPTLAHLGPMLAHLGPMLAPAGPTLAHLGPMLAHLGPMLAPSWGGLGAMLRTAWV